MYKIVQGHQVAEQCNLPQRLGSVKSPLLTMLSKIYNIWSYLFFSISLNYVINQM